MPPILEARHISKSYERHGTILPVLEDCNFSVSSGEAVAIMGASGSGKSTLLNILGGLEWADNGEILTDGNPLPLDDRKALEKWRAHGVGFVFQFHFLLPDFSALENLLIPIRAVRNLTDEDYERARQFLDILGLAARAEHLPGEMSGGEQQRVAVARAFMNRPDLILADEPFGNLDQAIGEKLGKLLFHLRDTEGCGLVIVTHDPNLAQRADSQLFLHEGKLIQGGPEAAATYHPGETNGEQL
jgi:lipoprotein-releasing system ATP-binding protein